LTKGLIKLLFLLNYMPMLESVPTTRPAAAGTPSIALRKPTDADGPAVWQLIDDCPPLDRNSRYCNLLQCTDFADTCIVAERGDDIVGWVSGYRLPNDPGTLFVWQVAVHPDARGEGLGKRMLSTLLSRLAQSDVNSMRTTVTRDNHASRAMFRALADGLGAQIRERPHFDADTHFDSDQDSEYLIEIGRYLSPASS
jgi:L-2,4-diaminobutyric acid acetyltransferase